MYVRPVLRPVAAGAILFFALAAAPLQREPTLTSLANIERGQWQLKQSDGVVRKLCVNSPTALLQLRHAGLQCKQTVISNQNDAATVSYQCTGHGYGQTTVSVETARLVRIETTGIVDGSPFQDEIEARKIGPCG